VTTPCRIVIRGTPQECGLRNSLISAAVACGCTVEILDWGPWKPTWLASAAFRQPKLAIGFRRELCRQIDALADIGPVDLVLVIKGPLLDSRTVDHLRRRFGPPVVCWNPDDPLDHEISNHGGGMSRAIENYDAYVTWSDDVAERISRMCDRVLVIPFAWDPEIMTPAPGDGTAAGRIVFIGTGTKSRRASLQNLAHLRPLVFGNNWERMDGIECHPAVLGNVFSKIIGEARWNINFLRPQNARSHNMRTFEIPGAGGNQVAPATADHERFLGRDDRTLLFRSHDELESLLRSDPRQLPPRSRNLMDGHTYRARLNQLLTQLKIGTGT
jgi:hypothetical protein